MPEGNLAILVDLPDVIVRAAIDEPCQLPGNVFYVREEVLLVSRKTGVIG